MSGRSGHLTIETLVAVALAAVAWAATAAALGSGGRLVARLDDARTRDDAVLGAIEAFTFDVRRAGFATLGHIDALAVARADRVTLTADDDGNGTIDTNASDVTTFDCGPHGQHLIRQLGAQRMPLVDGLSACRFGYIDAAGTPWPVPAGGLDTTQRRGVRIVRMELAWTTPTGATTTRRLDVALRSQP